MQMHAVHVCQSVMVNWDLKKVVFIPSKVDF